MPLKPNNSRLQPDHISARPTPRPHHIKQDFTLWGLIQHPELWPNIQTSRHQKRVKEHTQDCECDKCELGEEVRELSF